MVETTPPDGREKRALTIGLELRAAGGDGGSPGTGHGYAVLFNSPANIYDLWTEEFAPGAFATSLRERDVIALHSHDMARVVGRMNAGTLTLREDAKGLAFENPLPDNSDGRDLAVSIDRGDIPGMSFGFRAVKQTWDETVNPPKRTITEAELYEITYSAMPAYDDTEVGLRSLEGARAEKRSHNKAGAQSRIAARRARLARIERRI
jgi:HK97 family phage prohead protease